MMHFSNLGTTKITKTTTTVGGLIGPFASLHREKSNHTQGEAVPTPVRPANISTESKTLAKPHRPCNVWLTLIVVSLGIFSKWLWGCCWQYLGNPKEGLCIGGGLFVVRLLMALVAGGMTFVPVYEESKKRSIPASVRYMLAWQHGFIWQTIIEATHSHS